MHEVGPRPVLGIARAWAHACMHARPAGRAARDGRGAVALAAQARTMHRAGDRFYITLG